MKELLVIQITTEELQELIYDSVLKAFKELKKTIAKEEPEQLLTRKEVAKLLKISLPTLYYWTKEGKLKHYKTGSRVYYKKNEVMSALGKSNNYRNQF